MRRKDRVVHAFDAHGLLRAGHRHEASQRLDVAFRGPHDHLALLVHDELNTIAGSDAKPFTRVCPVVPMRPNVTVIGSPTKATNP